MDLDCARRWDLVHSVAIIPRVGVASRTFERTHLLWRDRDCGNLRGGVCDLGMVQVEGLCQRLIGQNLPDGSDSWGRATVSSDSTASLRAYAAYMLAFPTDAGRSCSISRGRGDTGEHPDSGKRSADLASDRGAMPMDSHREMLPTKASLRLRPRGPSSPSHSARP